MRIGALLVVPVCAITHDHACHFVGSRLVRVASDCEDGICLDLSLAADGTACRLSADLPPLSCENAVRMVESLLRDHRSGPPSHKRLRTDRTDELVYNINQFLVPSLEVVCAGGSPPLADLAGNLTLIHDWSWQAASADWESWRNTVIPAFIATETYEGMTRLFAHLLDAVKRSSFLCWQRREGMAALIHFYHDFAALMGIHIFGSSHVMTIGQTAAYSPPMHRVFQSAAFGHYGCPSAAGEVVKLSHAIDVLAREAENPPFVETDTFIRLLAGWVLNDSSTDALLLSQIRAGLCPVALTLVSAIDEQSWDPITIGRLGVSLIEICRGRASQQVLRDLRWLLALNSFDDDDGSETPDDGIPAPAKGSAVATFKEDELPWVLGLSFHLPAHEQQSVASWMLAEFVQTHVVFGVNEDGSDFFVFSLLSATDSVTELGLAFGRALGLCLLHNGDLGAVRLPLAFVHLLLPRNRRLLSSTAEIAAVLGAADPQVLEMSISTIAGLEETLGPGGPDMFTNAEWLRRFGH